MSKFVMLAALAVSLLAQDGRTIVEESQKRTRSSSQRYEGTLRVVDGRDRVTEKRWRFERIGSFGDSKSVLRFTAPAEVKGVALLIHNHKDRASDQWMWTPALQRDRRVALQDRSTRFFGTGFSFEDLEERDANQFDYKALGEESVDGAPCWKIEATPRDGKRSQYTHSHMWIRKDHYVVARVVAYKKDAVARRIEYRDIENASGIWTARTIQVIEESRKSKTVLKIEKLEYGVAMKEDDFTLSALRRE